MERALLFIRRSRKYWVSFYRKNKTQGTKISKTKSLSLISVTKAAQCRLVCRYMGVRKDVIVKNAIDYLGIKEV